MTMTFSPLEHLKLTVSEVTYRVHFCYDQIRIEQWHEARHTRRSQLHTRRGIFICRVNCFQLFNYLLVKVYKTDLHRWNFILEWWRVLFHALLFRLSFIDFLSLLHLISSHIRIHHCTNRHQNNEERSEFRILIRIYLFHNHIKITILHVPNLS